jgi:acetoin utilization deacetylase AcuC-like enzyme
MTDLVLYYPQGHQAHFERGHPERPERVEVVRNALQENGWWQQGVQIEALPVELEFLRSIHRAEYLETLQEVCQKGEHLDADTYTTPASWQLALNAAGGAVAVAQAVWSGAARRGFALTRPPGHHATAMRGMGFCLLNNVAIAGEYLLRQPQGKSARAVRLAIIDLDLHHGNGTQNIFWQRGDVLYISTHQSPLYPGSGRLEESGAGAGKGCTANFPLPPFTGDDGFQAIMQSLILPLLDRYLPDMLLVSFGFDPHWRDPLGSLILSAAGYGILISSLADWADRKCGGKIVLFLEGGYDLEAGKACTQAALANLLGQQYTDTLGASPYAESNDWMEVLRQAQKIWSL